MRVDEMLWRDWHAVAIVADLAAGRRYRTTVLGVPVTYWCDGDGLHALREDSDTGPCRIAERYATAWICLSDAPLDFFAIPEFDEPDRRVVGAGSIRLHVSGLRAVENFLDMGHFPYVHTGYLGAEPHTEVLPYDVAIDANNEILATNCRFVQPRASAIAADPIEVNYTYRVARPFVTMLYKTCVPAPDRRDVIGLFIQPLSEEWCVAHTVMIYLDDVNSDEELRRFQQTIFGQDLMILINQVPKRMPLEARHEIPVRADAMSSAYRRWLRENRIAYGTWQPEAVEA